MHSRPFFTIRVAISYILYHVYFLLYSPKWIKIYGEEYHIFDYVIIGRQAIDDLPVFAKITDILLILDYPVLEVTMHRTVGLSNHLMSYRIENSFISRCIPLSTLPEKHPYTAHTFDDGQLYITLRSHIEITLLNVL